MTTLLFHGSWKKGKLELAYVVARTSLTMHIRRTSSLHLFFY